MALSINGTTLGSHGEITSSVASGTVTVPSDSPAWASRDNHADGVQDRSIRAPRAQRSQFLAKILDSRFHPRLTAAIASFVVIFEVLSYSSESLVLSSWFLFLRVATSKDAKERP